MLQNELISGLLKDIDRMKKNLKDVNKEIRKERKITTEEYVGFKKAMKDLRVEIKDLEEQHELELAKDDGFLALTTSRMGQEEELAKLKEKLNAQIIKLPPEQMKFQFESEEGIVNAVLFPKMQIYFNGKEEKL